MKWVTRETGSPSSSSCRPLRSQGSPRQLTPESAGLYALASGFRTIARNAHENMRLQFPAHDALYAYCRATGDDSAA